MPVITISRQYASGGSDIGRRVAKQLGWPLVDNELIDRVAAEAGVSPQEVEAREERVPGLTERLARALAISSPEVFVATGDAAEASLDAEADLVKATEAVIEEVVHEEPRVILVGRGAQALLAQREDSLHVFVVAPRHVRIEAAMRRLGIGRDEAEEAVDRTDRNRRRYVKTHYDREWEHAANYHLVVNTGVFNYEQAAEMIVAAAGARGWR